MLSTLLRVRYSGSFHASSARALDHEISCLSLRNAKMERSLHGLAPRRTSPFPILSHILLTKTFCSGMASHCLVTAKIIDYLYTLPILEIVVLPFPGVVWVLMRLTWEKVPHFFLARSRQGYHHFQTPVPISDEVRFSLLIPAKKARWMCSDAPPVQGALP